MIKKLKAYILTAAASLMLFAPAVASAAASTDIGGNLCSGANLSTTGGGTCSDSEGTFSSVLSTIINILSLVIGVVAVIMVIIGGFNYITSGGDSGKVSTAKNTILYAVIGLVIVAFAQALVRFVINKAKPS